MNSFNAHPGELEYDDDYGVARPDGRVRRRGTCRTDGCENRSLDYCDSCLRRMQERDRQHLGIADAHRRQQMRRGAA